ncbi:protease complex subunit PrcB family protein [Chloroflexota bacterium]
MKDIPFSEKCQQPIENYELLSSLPYPYQVIDCRLAQHYTYRYSWIVDGICMRIRLLLLSIVICVILIGSCTPLTRLIPEEKPALTAPTATLADIETIDKGEYSGIKTRELLVIKSQAEWEKLWSKHSSLEVPSPKLPEIDYSQKMVIAVFSGWKPSGGYSIEIAKVELAEDEIRVYYTETSPEAGQPVTEAETQPFDIVKIESTGTLPVVFIENNKIR